MNMEENIIFKQPQSSQPVGTSPQSLPVQPPSGVPKSSQSTAKKFIKLILGILVVAIFGAVVWLFVFPRLQSEPKEEIVKLLYWGLLDDIDAVQSVTADFEKQNPNIKVSFAKQDIKQYRERILARIKNETGPDIFWFHNTWWTMLSDVLVPFPKDVITKSDFTTLYYKVAHKDLIRNGAIYGIPVGIDTLSLYINKDLFDAASVSAPTNWIDFANIAQELTVKDADGNIKTAGAAVGAFDNINHAGDIISLFLVQNGADLYNLSSNSLVASDALRFYTSFATDDRVWSKTFDSSLLAFARGEAAMYFGYSKDYFAIKSANPDINLEVHPVPHLPNRDITIASYWANGVSVKSKHQKEALLFVKFLSQKETQQKLFAEMSKSREFGEPYARVDLANLLKDNPVVYPFASQAENAVSSFFASDTEDNGLNDKANEKLKEAVNAILLGAPQEDTVNTLSQGVIEVLRLYSVSK